MGKKSEQNQPTTYDALEPIEIHGHIGRIHYPNCDTKSR